MNNYNFYAETIRQSVSMNEVVALYNLKLNRSGFICCPIHHEKTPSCKIYPNGKGWWCYGCNSGGSVIDFVMGVHKCSFTDALKIINSEFHLGLFDSKPDLRKAREFRKRQQREAAEDAETNTKLNRLTALYRNAWNQIKVHNPRKPYSEHELNLLSRMDYLDYIFEELNGMERGEKLSLLRTLTMNLSTHSIP